MERKGFGPRLAAAIIDAIIMLVVGAIIGVATGMGFVLQYGSMGGSGAATVAANSGAIRLFAVLSSLFALAYTTMEIFMAATPGKMILKMKIASIDGSPADMGKLMTRWAIKHSPEVINVIVALTGILFLARISQLASLFVFISCLCVLRATKLALHDDFAGTSIVGPATSVVPSGFPVMPPGSTPPPPVA